MADIRMKGAIKMFYKVVEQVKENNSNTHLDMSYLTLCACLAAEIQTELASIPIRKC